MQAPRAALAAQTRARSVKKERPARSMTSGLSVLVARLRRSTRPPWPGPPGPALPRSIRAWRARPPAPASGPRTRLPTTLVQLKETSIEVNGAARMPTRFITLIIGLSAGPAVSLNGSPTVSPTTDALWTSVPLPPRKPSSTFFLALSQLAPAFDMKTAINWPVRMVPPRNPPSAPAPRPKPTSSGAKTARIPGPSSSFCAVAVTISTQRAVVGLLLALHDSRMLAELAAHFEHDLIGRAADRFDRERAEQERHRAADHQADEHGRHVDLDADRAEMRLIDKGAEQRDRREHRGRNREALGQRLGGVADRVHPRQRARGLFLMDSAHLEDAVRVVGDRSVGVHREDEAGGGQQSEAGQRDSVELQRERLVENDHRADNRAPRSPSAPTPTTPGPRPCPTGSASPGRCAPPSRFR